MLGTIKKKNKVSKKNKTRKVLIEFIQDKNNKKGGETPENSEEF